MKKSINLTFGERTVNLRLDEFDEEVDIDSLLKIDYYNLHAELITFPVIVNRFGLLVADMDNKLSEAKLNLEVFTAKKKEELRGELTEEESDAKGNTKFKKPTVEELDNALTNNKAYQLQRKAVFKAQKERDYINSIFWAAKDKSGKLDKLSLSIQPGDFDETMLQKSMNGVSIKFKQNRIA